MSPDIRKHRGAHPEDRKLFADDQLPALRAAVAELSWLLTRDYKIKSALKLVGDKFALSDRQRLAVSRAACSDQSKDHRQSSRVPLGCLRAEPIVIDGFNLIITVEALLSRGVLMRGRDTCVRDLSSVHSSYRPVNETEEAIILIAEILGEVAAGPVAWILDKPISNSGRLAQRIRALAGERQWEWQVDVAFNPDRELVRSERIVISSDGPLLDRVQRWSNITEALIEKTVADIWLIDLSCG
jgi:hypothetical protein